MPTRNPHHLTHLNIPITHWAAAFLVVLILTAAYWANVGDVEKTIIFLALAATAAATLLNSIFTARSVQELIQDRNLRSQQTKIRFTLTFGRRWNAATMYRVRDVCKKILELHNDGKGVEIPEYADKHATDVAHVLNFLEEMAFAKTKEVLDPVLIRHQFEGIVLGLWQALGPWIRARREHRRRPQIWATFEGLHNEWSRH